ncbi:hypothetical protein UFOVP797_17 [uncultured Caudovirales phage]|uniref:Transglycosylase SLT domain-containing protein n=1 Tax=uncultured Caudovirales phage TaxID=2100421 RepID=A0A6J5P154_9CAUD|nr:hypothetical protein UFOVP797_17 [uncultured Caudovirales phage]
MSNKRHAALTSTFTSCPQFMSVSSQIKLSMLKVIHRRTNVALTSTFTSTIDSRDTLHIATRSPKGMAQAARLVLLASLLFILTGAPAYAEADTHKSTSKDYLKLYAHSRIINYEQFKCFDSLITRESHWNVKAKNGSHYGLGQMRNAKYRVLDGFTQVDWSIRYITKRYGSMCNGWRFFKAKGYH